MKIELDKRYMKKIKYFTLGFVIVYIIYAVIENLNIVYQTTIGILSRTLSILSPLIWGIVIAYLLLPLVKFFESHLSNIKFSKKNKSEPSIEIKRYTRMISITMAFAVVLMIIILLGYSIYMMVGGSVKDFSFEETWKYIQQYFDQYSEEIKNVSVAMEDLGISNDLLNYIDGFSESFSKGLQKLLSLLAARVGTIGKYFIDLSFGLVFSVNIMYNREYFTKLIDNTLKLLFVEKRRKSITLLFQDINLVISSFVRGRLIDLTLLSFVTAFSLIIIDFEFSFLVGVFAGYTNIIPYLGTWIGIIPAVIIALINEGVRRAFMVGLYIVVVQQIYIMLVSPKVQGRSIGIHPFFVLLSLIVFGALFGLMGMILSIPIAGIIKVIIIRWSKNRQALKNIELHDLSNYR
ncbi:putative PurR-regulated permease PerM [Natranaerovirga pectinivora]|uniref:Putative PurR-regulated permease PerM n=1 Tax=Natranaerovirga pectinivora TaxID=682400 RepID=A0A4R3MJL8_9FIRM|nr:AI-2E family transporter [Natranaerovirga pectinivora]TCT13934.1 putative PurR-regulated permease PerM [Natranaerovirga pectinivora]